jgi:hypothetical protein
MIKVLKYDIIKVTKTPTHVNLTTQYYTFKISIESLKFLHESIINTDNMYVYPTIFIKFYKMNVTTNAKIIYSDKDLYQLRVWVNVYKDMELSSIFNNELYNLVIKIMELSASSRQKTNQKNNQKSNQ